MTCTCLQELEDIGITTPCGAFTQQDIIHNDVIPFDEAVGAGAGATGGRAGTVFTVTSVGDSGPGTLREALESVVTPRAIVFNVSGDIVLNSRIIVTVGGVSIYGQSAPSPGIQVRGNAPWPGDEPLIDYRADNLIMQHMRFRLGDVATVVPSNSADNFFIGLNGVPLSNYMIDKCSFEWGIDENFNSFFATQNITLQHCIFGHPLVNAGHDAGEHSYGLEMGQTGSGCATVYKNLFSMCKNRGITVGIGGVAEVINNIFHNDDLFDNMIRIDDIQATGAGGHLHNVIGNQLIINGANNNEEFMNLNETGNGLDVYARDNISWDRPNQGLPQCDITNDAECQDTTRHPVCAAIPESAIAVPVTDINFISDIVNNAGADYLGADSVDAQIRADVFALTGTYSDDESGLGGYPNLTGGTPWIDTSGDGIPDSFKTSQGWNPATNDSATIETTGPNAGRSYLEIYVNTLR